MLPHYSPRAASARVALLSALALVHATSASATPASASRVLALPVPTPAAAPDTLRGVVFDSLTNQPLAGAFVTGEGAPVSTTTDSAGRFTLASDVPLTRVSAFHALLDATGINALSVARPAGAAPWTSVVLATPSIGTIWASLCKLSAPDNDNQGVVIGATRLPDNETRTAGAIVRVQYEEVLPLTGLRQLQELETVTDSLGDFIVCGVPLYSEAAMLATSPSARTAPVRIGLDGLPVKRLDLVLGPADGPIDRWPSVMGIVENVNGERVANAQVAIAGVDSAVLTDSTGSFTIAQVPTGSRMASVMAERYSPALAQFDVLYENNAIVVIALEPVLEIEGLPGVRVTERTSIRRARAEFEERRAAGIGAFVDSSEIRVAGSLPAALAQVPGVLIETASGETDSTQYQIRGRGRGLSLQSCAATVLVDGTPVSRQELYTVPTADIAAVEIYSSVSFAPAVLAQMADGDCAVVVVWTLFGLRP